MPEGKLRDFGVYLLLDGTKLIPVPEVDGCHLFRPAERRGPEGRRPHDEVKEVA
jgi:hypothetical protein